MVDSNFPFWLGDDEEEILSQDIREIASVISQSRLRELDTTLLLPVSV